MERKESVSNYKKTLNYFMYKLGFLKADAEEVLAKYANSHGFEDNKKAGDAIQANWHKFMQWWGKNKKDYKKSYFKLGSIDQSNKTMKQ